MLLGLFRRGRTEIDHCDPDSEITFVTRTSGYGNASHGDTCCLCGTLLPAVKRDPNKPRPFVMDRGLDQLQICFHRECSHGRGPGVWGGYVCSEACRVGIREWLREADLHDICPYQHWAKGVHGEGPPAAIFFELMEDLP